MIFRFRPSALGLIILLAIAGPFFISSDRMWLGLESTSSLAAGTNDEIHWTVMGQTAVTVDWRGPDSTIRYGLTSAYGQTGTAQTPTIVPYSSSGPFWEAKITGLQQNTLYHYSIGTGPDHTFKTPPLKGSSGFTIMVEADIGDSTSYSTVTGVQQLIAAQQPDLVLLPGDLTYGNAHGQAHVDQHFNDVMVWSQDSPYMPAWGNHEWDTSGDNLNNYKGRFDVPNPQTSPGSPTMSCCGEDWYWFDYGNTRIIAYPEPWSGAWADWSTKADTIMAQAQADPQISFIMTFGHRPPYTSTSGRAPGETSIRNIQSQLRTKYDKYVLNLAGHSHDYERTYPQNGLTHMVVGTGGATLYDFTTQPSTTAFRAKRLGALKLTVSATGIEGKFLCGPAGGGSDVTCTVGQVIDTFTIGTPSSCTENWSCGGWSSCVNGTQSRTCTDANACGPTVNRPPLTQSCTPTCTESWTCGAWSVCSNNSQSRTCTDANACGTTTNRPLLSQSCTGSCTENWSCTSWSACTNNNQTRICTDANACGTTTNKPAESLSCVVTPPGTELFHDDFEDGDSQGWTTVGGGSWSVVTDGSLTYQQATANGDAWSTVGSTSWTDYAVQAEIKPGSFEASGFVGLYGRWQDNNHWYYLKMTATQLELKKNVGGTISVLATASVPFPVGSWRTVKLVMNGSNLQVWIDGAQQLTATDGAITNGQLALGTYAATAKFDEVSATSITSTSAPAAPTNVQVSTISSTSLQLSWTASTSQVAGYTIRRGTTSGGPYTTIGTSLTTTYTDTGLSPATIYYYIVQAFDQSQNASANSNQATGITSVPPDVTPPAPIQDLLAS